jgi:hypothetical protein
MLIPHWRKVLLCSCLFAALTALGTGLARVAAKSATEAPAGFNTPSFNGAQSHASCMTCGRYLLKMRSRVTRVKHPCPPDVLEN